MTKIGVLLVNLGTPKSPSNSDVYSYLNEFLTDPRVIDIPWLKRQILVRGIITPFRHKKSAETYRRIWTSSGSPLMKHSCDLQEKLQKVFDPTHFKIALAMRYQDLSIIEALESLKKASVSHLVVCPLFPQYASATTGSIQQKVMECLKDWQVIPSTVFISSYADHPSFIHSLATIAREADFSSFDHLLISFHGLPEKQLKKADSSNICLKSSECCLHRNSSNHYCYRSQCFATAHALAKELQIDSTKYSISFQSRLGKGTWTQPYTADVIKNLAAKGYKKVAVICPAFISDCLETLFEIGIEYQEEFIALGGEKLSLIPCVNSHPVWISALKEIISDNIPKAFL